MKNQKIMTWNELLDYLESRGANLAYLALGNIMDDVAAENGHWPDWSDPVPDDVMRMFFTI